VRSLKTPDDKKATKPKKSEAPAPKAVTFPATIRINAYGFIGLRKGLLEALGWSKSMRLQIDKNPDGSVTIKSAP
jgi:hypothetical protein